MSVYTVHTPPAPTSAPNPERFVFVRDGFFFWAFVLGPLWLLWRRLWLVCIGYIALLVAMQTGLYLIGVSGPGKWLAGVLLSLLLGFEAATLWRWTLARRGWTNAGIVVGDDLESAERRFFDAWLRADVRRPLSPLAPPAGGPVAAAPVAGPQIVGLFPHPGGAR